MSVVEVVQRYTIEILEMFSAANLLRALAVLVVGQIVVRLGSRIIDRLPFTSRGLAKRGAAGAPQDERRALTLRGILKSVLRFTVHALVILIILETFGVRTSSLLAGAGVVGLALGLGAQNLIRDVLAGMFIVYEDQFNVGDHVTWAGVTGIVEEMGLRVAKVRDFGGQLHFIPYGVADKVTNHTRGTMRALVEVPVSFDESPRRVLDALSEACRSVAETSSHVREAPSVLGITSLEGQRVVYTIVARAEAMGQWALEREIRLAVSEVFQRMNINPPDPLGEALARGAAPPVETGGPAPAGEPAPPHGVGPAAGGS
ncbi:MAG: mechanosensitive ion channel family protein [Firmicutes bacterium]|nr:mechanosensitive ion channel family protein [Bacillota bacterium]